MTTLKLNKENKGYYTNQYGSIKLTISEWNGQWSGIITDESKTLNEEYSIFECYGKTKTIVVAQVIEKLKYLSK
jgi:hypothetical protein